MTASELEGAGTAVAVVGGVPWLARTTGTALEVVLAGWVEVEVDVGPDVAGELEDDPEPVPGEELLDEGAHG
ncbi:MAG TPA: hypothetical protein VMB82_03975 [Acidimicrobiales bacterium]|nr:hypothetical protein [Acidimicrobiales bacterium]